MRTFQNLSTRLFLSVLWLCIGAGLLHGQAVPAPSGLVSWWPGEGDATDIVGPNNGALLNGLGFTTGKVGQGYNFDGVDDTILVPASESLNVGAGPGFTLECWINPTDVDNQHPLFEWMGESNNLTDLGVLFWAPAGDAKTLCAELGPGSAPMTSPVVLQTNVFQHVALTYDKASGIAKIYYNGALVQTASLGAGFIPKTSNALLIGRRMSIDNWYFSGILDEPSLYGRALTSDEIAAIYNAGTAGKIPPAPTPPSITTQPVDQAVGTGRNVTFSIIASGSHPLSYQWSKDASTITGATNATLTLLNTQTNDSGAYSVTVTNLYGSTNSYTAVLTVTNIMQPIISGLVSWWPGEGDANDVVGPNNGTLMGGLGFATGKVGQGFNFDGVDDTISVPPSDTLNVGTGPGFTLECWINPTDVDNQHPLFEWMGESDNLTDIGVMFWAPAGDPKTLCGNIIDTAAQSHIITSPVVLQVGVFQHVALTFDKASGIANIYYNGALVQTASLGTNFTPKTSNNLLIGRRHSIDDWYFSGIMDEPSVYNRALTSDEIAAIYNADAAGKAPPEPTPPLIVTQPVDESAAVGSGVSFSVTATGSRPLSYQWSKDASTITGATNATLTLLNLQTNDSGAYSVAVTNLYGSTNSANANLTVTNIVNGPPPTLDGMVSWWPGEGDATDVVGPNNGTLLNGLGFAAGEVGQAFNFTGTNMAVRVPTNASLDVGSAGGFTVECWINPANVSLNGNVPIVEWNDDTYWGVHLAINYNGGPGNMYANVVDNGGGWHFINSGAGLITGNTWQHVALTYDKASGIARLYRNGTVAAEANLGSYTARTSGRNLYIGRRVAPIGDASNTYIGLIDEVSLYNRALGSNEIAAIYSAGGAGKTNGTPGIPPAITTQPANQTVLVGSDVSFSVAATGAEPLTYQWHKGMTNIPGETNVSLTLSNVQLADAAIYRVTVANPYGSIYSSNAVLIVTNPPSAPPAPLSGMVSWWPGEGDANDIVGTNNGALQNGLDFAEGEVGKAFNYTSNTMDVRVPASDSIDVGNGAGFTVELWVNPTAAPLNGNAPLVEWNDDTYWGVHLAVNYNGEPGNLYANVVDDGGGWHFINSGGGALTSNIWQHVALTYDKASGVAVLYVNGAIAAQENLGSYTPRTAGRNLHIGRRVAPAGDADNTFDGLIDEVSLYNRALSGDEIASIYNAGSAGKSGLLPPPAPSLVNLNPIPLLSISAAGNGNLTLKWPSWAGDFMLQSADATAHPAWSNLTVTLETNGDSIEATVPAAPTPRIFRLQNP